MQFGRVLSIEGAHLSLPPNDPRNRSNIVFTTPEPTQIFYGCPIWNQKAWVGDFYPPKTKTTEFLQIYSQQVSSIELNSTFYGIPEADTVSKWLESSTPGFKFCPKFPQSISHAKTLMGKPELIANFAKILETFGTKLGLSFFQLPETTTLHDLEYLSDLFSLLPKNLPIAIEFRHPSWFQDGKLNQAALELLQENNLSTVISDTPGRRDVVHSTLTNDRVMVRFVGHNLHPTDSTRLTEWAERLAVWLDLGIKELYFFLHEPDDKLAPELVRIFVDLYNQRFPNNPLPQWRSYKVDETAHPSQVALL